jgi:hypothetical protein
MHTTAAGLGERSGSGAAHAAATCCLHGHHCLTNHHIQCRHHTAPWQPHQRKQWVNHTPTSICTPLYNCTSTSTPGQAAWAPAALSLLLHKPRSCRGHQSRPSCAAAAGRDGCLGAPLSRVKHPAASGAMLGPLLQGRYSRVICTTSSFNPGRALLAALRNCNR